MKQSTRDWVERAEADFDAASLLHRSRKKYSRDIVCFHLQQCVEKYFKARLIEENAPFPKTHDLEQLLVLLGPIEPLWVVLRAGLIALTTHAVESRYPGRSVTSAELRDMVAVASKARLLARTALGLK